MKNVVSKCSNCFVGMSVDVMKLFPLWQQNMLAVLRKFLHVKLT